MPKSRSNNRRTRTNNKRQGRRNGAFTNMNQMVSALQSLAPDAPDSTGEFRANPLDFVPKMPIVRFSPPVFGFPDRLMTKLRYHQLGNLNSTLGAVGTQVFRWNSIFDPDATGIGHQPLYRDQLAGIYDHYSVVRARAQLRFTNDSSDPFAVGALTDDDTTGPSAIDTLCEQSHGLHAILSPLTGSRSSVRFQLAWDCQKILGIDPFNTQGYKTTVASNPAEESDLICWAADLAGSTAGVLYDIEIEYEVLWTELADPGAS